MRLPNFSSLVVSAGLCISLLSQSRQAVHVCKDALLSSIGRELIEQSSGGTSSSPSLLRRRPLSRIGPHQSRGTRELASNRRGHPSSHSVESSTDDCDVQPDLG